MVLAAHGEQRRHRLLLWEIRPRLDKQDAAGGIFGETRRDDAAARARADNNDVELVHGRSSKRARRRGRCSSLFSAAHSRDPSRVSLHRLLYASHGRWDTSSRQDDSSDGIWVTVYLEPDPKVPSGSRDGVIHGVGKVPDGRIAVVGRTPGTGQYSGKCTSRNGSKITRKRAFRPSRARRRNTASDGSERLSTVSVFKLRRDRVQHRLRNEGHATGAAPCCSAEAPRQAILCLDPALARFRELPLIGGHPTHNYFFGQGLAVRPFNSI